MFLSIIQGKKSSLYECKRFHITPKGNDLFFIDLEPCGITIAIDKSSEEKIGVYAMNNDGRTIETIFSKDKDKVLIPETK